MWADFNLFSHRQKYTFRSSGALQLLYKGFNILDFISIYPRSVGKETLTTFPYIFCANIYSVEIHNLPQTIWEVKLYFYVYWLVLESILPAIFHPLFDKYLPIVRSHPRNRIPHSMVEYKTRITFRHFINSILLVTRTEIQQAYSVSIPTQDPTRWSTCFVSQFKLQPEFVKPGR
jgi:hypothetical protein